MKCVWRLGEVEACYWISATGGVVSSRHDEYYLLILPKQRSTIPHVAVLEDGLLHVLVDRVQGSPVS